MYKPDFTYRGLTIPRYTFEAIKDYIDNHVEPGDFLKAVICNNLINSVSRADEDNLKALPVIAAYFYNAAPHKCWGNEKKMKAWLNQS